MDKMYKMNGRKENLMLRSFAKEDSNNLAEEELGNYSRQKPMKQLGNGNHSQDGIALYIKYVPSSFTQESFEALLSKFGKVLSVYIGKPNQKYLASQLVFSIVKVASMRDAVNIMENVHRKPPLNLSVEFAKSSEEKRTNASRSFSTHSPTVQESQDYSNMIKKFPNGFLGSETEELKSHSTEDTPFDMAATDTKSTAVVLNGCNGQNALPRSGKCVNCTSPGSKRCSICKAWYCSESCQLDDWYHHQERCRPPPPLEDAYNCDFSQVDHEPNVNGEVVSVDDNSVQEINDIQEDDGDSVNGTDVSKRDFYSFAQLMKKDSAVSSQITAELKKSPYESANEYNVPQKSINKPMLHSRQSVHELVKSPPQPVVKHKMPHRSGNERQILHLVNEDKMLSSPASEDKMLSSPANEEKIPLHHQFKKHVMLSSEPIKPSKIPINNEIKEIALGGRNKDDSLKNFKMVKERKKFLKGELYAEPLEIGSKYAVLPTWIEDDIVYVQLFTEQMKELISDMTAELIKHCSSAAVPDAFIKNEIICAYVPEDGIWYRGEVVDVDNDKVLVYFIDFGNTSLIPVNNTRVCNSSFMQIPIIVIPVKPIGECGEKEKNEIINSLIDNYTPILMDVQATSPYVEVELWDIAEEKKILPHTPPTENVDMNLKPSMIECLAHKLLKSGAVKPMLSMYDECKSTSLPLEKNVEIVVLQPTNPLCFFLTPKASIHLYEDLEDLSGQMNEYCDSLHTHYYEPKEGEVCLAKYSTDGLWYRACCVTIDTDAAADLIFVDYGNHERVSFRNMCQMVDKFLEMPLIAIHCQIKGFSLEEVKTGGSKLNQVFQKSFPSYSTHTVNVLSKCEESHVYQIEIPSISVQDLKREAFA